MLLFHKFESPYVAISLDKILTCQMAQGSYCEINKPLFTIDKTKQCAIYLFNHQRSQINKYCKVDFIYHTTDLAMLYLLQENKTWHKVLKHFIKTLNIMK